MWLKDLSLHMMWVYWSEGIQKGNRRQLVLVWEIPPLAFRAFSLPCHQLCMGGGCVFKAAALTKGTYLKLTATFRNPQKRLWSQPGSGLQVHFYNIVGIPSGGESLKEALLVRAAMQFQGFTLLLSPSPHPLKRYWPALPRVVSCSPPLWEALLYVLSTPIEINEI